MSTQSKPLSLPNVRTGLLILAGLGSLAAGLLLAFYLFFPAETIRARLTYELGRHMPAKVLLESVGLHPLLTLHGRQLTFEQAEQPWSPLIIDTFQVSPAWGSLFTAAPGCKFTARLMAGHLDGFLLRNGTLKAVGQGLKLSIPLRPESTLRLAGTLVRGALQSQIPLQKGKKSHLEMQLTGVQLQGLAANGKTIQLGEVVLEAVGQGESFTVKRLEASGGELAGSGKGSVMVGATAEKTRLNLTLALQLAEGADPTLATLLDLVTSGGTDGNYQFRLTGPLTQPVIKER